PLVHEGNLKIEIDSADQEEENQNDVGDRRVKITADFAKKECVEFSHLVRSTSWLIQPDLIRMRNLDEHVFERGPALRKLAQRPSPRRRELKNFRAHIQTGFDSQRKN